MQHDTTRRRCLALVTAGAVATAGCLGSDDNGNGANGDNGDDSDPSELDPAEVCDEPGADGDPEAMLPPDEGGSFSKGGSDAGREGAVEAAYHSYRHETEDGVYWAVAARYEDPDVADFQLEELADRPGPAEMDGATVYVHVGHWVFMTDGDDEDLNRDLLAEFPEVSADCAQAAVPLWD